MQLDLSVQQSLQHKEDPPGADLNKEALQLPPCMHFIETTPSVLRDIPWIQLREHKVHIHDKYNVIIIIT